MLKWSIEWNARTWGIWTKHKCLYLLQEVRGGRTSEEMFFKCFYIEKRVEVYKLKYHGIFRLWCVASLKIFFIRIEFKNLQKKKTSKALGRNNLLSTATRNMKFHKTFLVMSEVHVCREGFVFVTNKYISTATVTHVKRHYSETDWKMSKLRLCQLKLGFFNQFPALYLSENNFN